MTRFPPDLLPRQRFSAAWPVALALLWVAVRLNLALGGPGLRWNSEIYLAVDVIIAVSLLGILAHNYGQADPVGRRRIK